MKQMTPTKQEMLEKIYEVIADKTLSFGCNVYYNPFKNNVTVSYVSNTDEIYFKSADHNLKMYISDIEKIIWHPVMIWDVLDWRESKCNIHAELWFDEWIEIFWYWKDKRKPINDQSDECITFIFNLTNPWTNH